MDTSKLKAGDPHYVAYVGNPGQYDFMGATQFRLLCTLGLRATHTLLDFGCGSLRAGRLFIGYLDEGKYFGVEPNKWLIDEAITNQIGNDLIKIKKPRFDHNSDFSVGVFGVNFDFIVAQSIFSHAGPDLIRLALMGFKESLNDGGLIAATFGEGAADNDRSGWTYPGCVFYRRSTIRRFGEDLGLFNERIPWFHPRLQWYLLAKDRRRLPTRSMKRHLSGRVLFDPELSLNEGRISSRGFFRRLRNLWPTKDRR